MSDTPFRFVYGDKSGKFGPTQKNSPLTFRTPRGEQRVFKEQKRPKFLLPKSERTSGAADVPKFSISSPGQSSHHRTSPAHATLLQKRRREVGEDIHSVSDGAGDASHIHNPFDVSDELDEPVPATTITPQRQGPSRFLAQTTSSTKRPISAGGVRSTAQVLSAIRFDGKHQAAREETAATRTTLPADWSPHKKRLRQGERLQFVPGGMAQTVALWIYEEECKQRFQDEGL